MVAPLRLRVSMMFTRMMQSTFSQSTAFAIRAQFDSRKCCQTDRAAGRAAITLRLSSLTESWSRSPDSSERKSGSVVGNCRQGSCPALLKSEEPGYTTSALGITLHCNAALYRCTQTKVGCFVNCRRDNYSKTTIRPDGHRTNVDDSRFQPAEQSPDFRRDQTRSRRGGAQIATRPRTRGLP
jgi:hypothetical protein